MNLPLPEDERDSWRSQQGEGLWALTPLSLALRACPSPLQGEGR
ncbi:hypothetical protein SPAN111604_04355 [Sphingomonas antarctica]